MQTERGKTKARGPEAKLALLVSSYIPYVST
jgi:hypothetical protein